jgi:hypothetical protein
MNRRRIAGLGLLAATALLLIGAGIAQAADDSDSGGDGYTSGDRYGYPSTQSPTQGVDSGQATVDNGRDGFQDAADAEQGHGRPHGADGTESRFGDADPRLVEGPAGGLLKNGPLE